LVFFSTGLQRSPVFRTTNQIGGGSHIYVGSELGGLSGSGQSYMATHSQIAI